MDNCIRYRQRYSVKKEIILRFMVTLLKTSYPKQESLILNREHFLTWDLVLIVEFVIVNRSPRRMNEMKRMKRFHYWIIVLLKFDSSFFMHNSCLKNYSNENHIFRFFFLMSWFTIFTFLTKICFFLISKKDVN